MSPFPKSAQFFLLVLSLAACSTNTTEDIIGNWQAFEVLEEGEPLLVNTQEIQFSFHEDESYEYFSTLNYREAGSYYIEAKYLFTRDTINQASSEKAVEIVQLNLDTMILHMQESNKERILKLEKVENLEGN